MEKNDFNNKINVENYTDLEGVSTKKLTRGLWYLENKENLRKLLIMFLILVGGVSWSYTLYGFAYYLFVGMKQDDKNLADTLATPGISHQLILQRQAAQLQTGVVMVFNSLGNKFDFLDQLVNPNSSQWATFNYYFQTENGSTTMQQGFILPEETKYITALGETFDAMPVDAKLVVESINWKRLDPRQLPDWPAYKAEHLNIEIKDIKFTPARATGLSEKIGLSQLEFNAINNSAYNFWQMNFFALMYSQGNIIGINQYNIQGYLSGETRLVQASYPDQLGRVDKIEVIPEINIIDKNVFKDFEASAAISNSNSTIKH